MIFNRTNHYYEAVKNYRKSLRIIWDEFDSKMESIEQYMGSDGYTKRTKELETALNDSISALQDEYRGEFSGIIRAMFESATSRPMIAPTPEELSLLQALKMRERIGKDELEQAGLTLKGCPVGLSILNEIAEKNEIRDVHFGAESTTDVLSHIDSLSESAKRICALKKCDSRREMISKASIHNPEHDDNALYSFHVDRDFISEEDMLSYLGCVKNFDSFREAVNN